MATAADLVIAEVGELVIVGAIAPEDVHAAPVRRPPGSRLLTSDPKTLIAARAARELRPGDVVNLGIGIPNLIPGLLDRERGVVIQTENGLLGVGPRPAGEEDADDIDRSKLPVTALPGAAYFDSVTSFAMIRGGHVDVAVLGALQVSSSGDIANWAVPGRACWEWVGRWTSWSARSASL